MLKQTISRNISRYRKEQGLTQEALARQLNVSFQAVSKWENAHTLPDISLLPKLAQILDISVDKLLGYVNQDRLISKYEEEYKIEDYYWGVIPSTMCYRILELMPPIKPLKVLDMGCGEGKDAVFLARNGYQVTAFDISDAGIEKTKRLADQAGVDVHVFKADLLDYRLDTEYDILFSSGVLHYIRPDIREELFDNYKTFTNNDGLHVFNVFVEKPFIAPPPEKEDNFYMWKSGELFTLYHDWLLKDCSEIIFDCQSSGIPHEHAMNKMIAQKVEVRNA